MNVLRVLIEGWTASFRYPAFISGFQPTLPVPPLSTIYGLLSAVKGELTFPHDVKVGFIFESEAKTADLETIYELKGLKGNKSNITKREFLFNPKLYLYLDDTEFKKYFKKPEFPILLGRSSDVAMIRKIEEVELEKKSRVTLGKTILPLGINGAYGTIQSLPTHFTNTIPRKSLGTKPFILMDRFFDYDEECYYDSELEWGVWIHE